MSDDFPGYALTLDHLRMLAQQDLADWWANTSRLSPPVRMDTLREAFHAIQSAYGEQAALMAAENLFLKRSLDESLSQLEFPAIAEPVAYEKAAAGFNWATAKYREDFDPEALGEAQGKLSGVLNRLVAQPAHDTHANAIIAAGTGYARVPEPGACSFCLMLASRGAAYSREAVESANRYHDNCRCVAIEVKDDASLPRINRELKQLWDSTGKKLGATPTDRQFQEALIRYKNKTPDWVPRDAVRFSDVPKNNRGLHPGVKSVEELDKHHLFGTPSTLASTVRTKQEQRIYDSEERVIDWIKGNGASEVRRVGLASEAVPSLPEDFSKTPDIAVEGLTADIKTIRAAKGIQKNAKKGAEQSAMLIFDVRDSELQRNEVLRSGKNAVRDYGDRLERIVIIGRDFTFLWEGGAG